MTLPFSSLFCRHLTNSQCCQDTSITPEYVATLNFICLHYICASLSIGQQQSEGRGEAGIYHSTDSDDDSSTYNGTYESVAMSDSEPIISIEDCR